ncbi:MAG: NYN domain-containing protein [Hyphomonadaceae bacterium]|nr:NYN domain-containing protein [Hyphomonadaceae bacterium]
MAFYKDEKLALFIDGTNLYAAARGLGLEIDFRKLIQEFRKRGRLLRANYYTTIAETDEHNPVRPLVDWLSYNGFNTIVKNAREYTDRDGRRRFRGSMDIEMATDMLELAPSLDHLVLFSGNGDFRRAVEAVKAKGVRVTVISSVKSQPQVIADELRREADAFIDLDEMAELIARPRKEDEQDRHPQENDYDE